MIKSFFKYHDKFQIITFLLTFRFMTFTSAAFNFAELRAWTNNSDGDIIYNCLPLYHLAGGGIGAGVALIYGLPVALRSKFSATNYWKDCIKYKCTVRSFVIYRQLDIICNCLKASKWKYLSI